MSKWENKQTMRGMTRELSCVYCSVYYAGEETGERRHYRGDVRNPLEGRRKSRLESQYWNVSPVNGPYTVWHTGVFQLGRSRLGSFKLRILWNDYTWSPGVSSHLLGKLASSNTVSSNRPNNMRCSPNSLPNSPVCSAELARFCAPFRCLIRNWF